MTSLAERKQKFIESLTILGSFLVVFLGLVADKASILLTYTIGLGVLFIISALFSYTVVLFGDMLEERSVWVKSAAKLAHAVLAVAFANLVSLGAAIALTLAFPGALGWEVGVGAGVVFMIASFGVYLLIVKVLSLKEPEAKQPATSDNAFAKTWTG